MINYQLSIEIIILDFFKMNISIANNILNECKKSKLNLPGLDQGQCDLLSKIHLLLKLNQCPKMKIFRQGTVVW